MDHAYAFLTPRWSLGSLGVGIALVIPFRFPFSASQIRAAPSIANRLESIAGAFWHGLAEAAAPFVCANDPGHDQLPDPTVQRHTRSSRTDSESIWGNKVDEFQRQGLIDRRVARLGALRTRSILSRQGCEEYPEFDQPFCS